MSYLDYDDKLAEEEKLVTQRPPIEAPESRLIRLGGIPDPFISNFVSSIPENFSQLTGILRASLPKEPNAVNSQKTFISGNRIMLEKYARQFHSQSETLTDSVAQSLSLLSDPDTVILTATHQPNLFPYSGVIRKIILLESLKRHLQHLDNGAKVVNLFVIIDQEFADDKWIGRAELPSINHEKGVLALSLRLSNSDKRRMVKNVPKPSSSVLKQWEKQITAWIFDNLQTNISQDAQTAKSRTNILQESQYFNNFRQFWTQVQYAHSLSQTLSDFNSFTLARVMNDILGLDTIFVRLTELSPAVKNGIAYLIKNFDRYSANIRRTEMTLLRYGINSRVGSNVYSSAPVWLHCNCGGKASVRMSSRDGKHNDDPVLAGNCVRCGMYLERSIGKKSHSEFDEMIEETSLRAIPIPLLLSRDLGVSCYITGTGGVGYLTDAAVIANELSIPFPIVALWSGRDIYQGLAQRASLKRINVKAPTDIESRLKALEIDYAIYASKIKHLIKKRSERIKNGCTIDHELQDLFVLKQHQRSVRSEIERAQRAANAIKLSPCYIDHVVNFGLRNSFSEWYNYLHQTGDLLNPFKIESDSFHGNNVINTGTTMYDNNASSTAA